MYYFIEIYNLLKYIYPITGFTCYKFKIVVAQLSYTFLEKVYIVTQFPGAQQVAMKNCKITKKLILAAQPSLLSHGKRSSD